MLSRDAHEWQLTAIDLRTGVVAMMHMSMFGIVHALLMYALCCMDYV
jgi:hypothetical protein